MVEIEVIIKKIHCDECGGTTIQSYVNDKAIYGHCIHEDTAESEDEIRHMVLLATQDVLENEDWWK